MEFFHNSKFLGNMSIEFWFQMDIDECEEDYELCQNDGYCLNEPGGYDCLCMDGFQGNN